jgi:hypothetical protein
MQFSGGNANIRGDVTNNPGGQVFTAGGIVSIFFDDVTNNGSIFTSSGARSVFFGSYSGAGSLPGGGTNEFVGDTRPGNSPASIQIAGNAIFDSPARLFIEIGGTTVGTQYDKVNVAGQLTLGGTLNVSFINSFSPAIGNSFNILDWATESGVFSSISLPALSSGLAWNTTKLYSAGTISVIDANFLPGDVNRDGHVDVADVASLMAALSDLTAYQATHGPGGSALTDSQLLQIADLTGDNLVTNADIQGLINLLANGGGSSSLSAVPEPNGLALTVMAAISAISLRCKWRRR